MIEENSKKEEVVQKKEIRSFMLGKREKMEEDRVGQLSQIICKRVCEQEAFADASDICLYMPIRNEVDVTCLIEPAKRQKKRIWLPKVIEGKMDFYYYDNTVSLAKGKYDILEPQSDRMLIPDEHTLIIMPGAAFSYDGSRIGYGGGYYDCYLHAYPFCKTIAVCYDFQILPQIPSESHDCKADIVISDI